MFQHRFDESVSNKVALHWFLLSFNGGCINAGGFLATGRFVSHVTGFATLFGVDLTQGHLEAAFGILSVPVFFLIGSFVAGLLIDRPLYQGRKPYFEWVMVLCALCLMIAAGTSFLPGTSSFGDTGLHGTYTLLILLCLASGLQNAAMTASSGKTVRTTHLTGLTTDLGLGLARLFTIGVGHRNFKSESRISYLRVGSIASFILGSAIGATIFIAVGYPGFLLPMGIAFYTAWHGRNAKGESPS